MAGRPSVPELSSLVLRKAEHEEDVALCETAVKKNLSRTDASTFVVDSCT